MPDYKEMYHILFHEMTKAISVLQNVQQKTEEMYIGDDPADSLIVMNPNQGSDGDKEQKRFPQK